MIQQTLRYYAFDCLVFNGTCITHKDITKRYAVSLHHSPRSENDTDEQTLMQFIVQPFEKGLKANPDWRNFLPFEYVSSFVPPHIADISPGWQPKSRIERMGYHKSWNILRNSNMVTMASFSLVHKRHMSSGQMKRCTLYLLDHIWRSLRFRLKWKPASENSIDFKLRLRFPPSPHDPDTPNFTAKPAFLLYTWLGGSANSNSSYEFFDSMDMSDEEWEE